MSSSNSTQNASPSALETGLGHLRDRRFSDAVASLIVALQNEPGRVPVVRALATAHLLKDDVISARKVLGEFVSQNPMTAEGWRLAGQLEWKVGNRQTAIEILRRGIDQLPSSSALHRQLLVFLAASDKVSEASGHVEQACGDNTSSAQRVQEYLAAAVGAWNRPGQLITPITQDETISDPDLLDTIATDPKLLESVLRLPIELQDRQMLMALEYKMSQLLESQPHHADRQLLLAKLQMKLGSDTAAMLSLQRALRTNPDFVEAHRLRAQLHAQAGEIDGAIEILQGLLKRKLAWPDIHYQIAALQQKRGRLTEARTHLYKAIQLNPQFEQARQLLAQCVAA